MKNKLERLILVILGLTILFLGVIAIVSAEECEWDCSDWSSCSSGEQQRICNNFLSCNGSIPDTIQDCSNESIASADTNESEERKTVRFDSVLDWISELFEKIKLIFQSVV